VTAEVPTLASYILPLHLCYYYFLNQWLSVPLTTAKQVYFTDTYNIHLSYFSHMNTQQDKGKKGCFSL